MSNDSITVLFANSLGSGFATPVVVPNGTTIATLFMSQMGQETAPSGYVAMVRRGSDIYGGTVNEATPNRFPLEASFVLQHGDRVSITPHHMKGA